MQTVLRSESKTDLSSFKSCIYLFPHLLIHLHIGACPVNTGTLNTHPLIHACTHLRAIYLDQSTRNMFLLGVRKPENP